MLTTFSFSSPAQLHHYSSQLHWFALGSLAHLSHGRNFSLEAWLNGTVGQSIPCTWQQAFPYSKSRKFSNSFPTYSNSLAEKSREDYRHPPLGPHPSITMLAFYSPLFMEIFLLSLQPTTVLHQHSGNTSSRFSMMRLPSPRPTNCTFLSVPKSQSFGALPSHPWINFLGMFHLRGMFGSVFVIPTQTNENSPRNPKIHYFGLYNRCHHSFLSFHSTVFAPSISKKQLLTPLQQTTPGEWVVGSPSQLGPFGSAKHGRNQNSPVSSQWKKTSKGTYHFESTPKVWTTSRSEQQQSGSDNTGAEANINHGFSTTEVLSDIIKLVSLVSASQQHLLLFSQKWNIRFNLNTIFDNAPFPRYCGSSDPWDGSIHPLAKTA